MAVTPGIVERFGQLIAETIHDGDDRTTCQAYVRLLIDRVEVGKHQIRITGLKRNLAKLASGTPPQLVPKAERGWRARLDSNQRPRA